MTSWVVRLPDMYRWVESFSSETRSFDILAIQDVGWTSEESSAHRFINRDQAVWVAYSVGAKAIRFPQVRGDVMRGENN